MLTDAAAIALALTLLGTGPDSRVTVIGAAQAKPMWAHYERSCAFVVEADPRIFIGEWCPMFQEARKGDARALAAVIAHEQFHKDAHADEGPAYQRQLDVLHALRAKRTEIQRVRRIQAIVAPTYRVLKSRTLTRRSVVYMMPAVAVEGGLNARSDTH